MVNDMEALEFYEKAIQEEPNSADGWYGKADVLRRLGRATEEDKALSQARELHDLGYERYSEPDVNGLISYLPAVSV
ncbi:MAG: hypothetical protein QG575_415 [Euryarchaeota archaeon]|nr:hypothetical protein [Euryarchaeota archaeon]